MTAPPSDIDRKVRQLDNDVQAIYEMLTAIQGGCLPQSITFSADGAR